MSKRLMLLALAAVSAMMFALPAVASAEDEYLHLNPTPVGPQTIDDTGPTDPTLSTSGGTTIVCNSFHGEAEFDEGGTTGEMQLTFGPDCRVVGLGITCTSAGENSGNIQTTVLPFDLVTLPGSEPGVLVTPGENEHFATFFCFGVETKVEGNGVIGTLEFPECGAEADEADIDFNATSHGQQEHKKVAGTTTEYDLRKGSDTAAQDATGTLTLDEEVELDCT